MRRISGFFLAVIFLMGVFTFTASADEVTAPNVQSTAAVVMDANTGSILFQKNMDKKLSPADTIQILTVLLGIESGKSGESVTVSKDVIDTVDREGTHISLVADEKVKLKDLFYATILASASDAAKTIAVAVGGTEASFVEEMNLRMKKLGAVNTSVTNSDGAFDENNYTTAYDLALLTKTALKNKEFYNVFTTSSYTMDETNKSTKGRSFSTLCLLLKNSDMNVKYENAVGGKTGWNKSSGYNLVAVAEKDGRTLISVILDAETSKARYEETVTLFDYAFSSYRNVLVPASLLKTTEIPVIKNGTIVRKINVSIPENTYLTTNADFQEGTMTLSSLPNHVSEGDTNLRLTVSAKDKNNTTVVLGTVILEIQTEEVRLEESPGGEKIVPVSFGVKLWRVVKTILLVLLFIVGGILLIAVILFLTSYLQRRNRKKRRKQRLEEQRKAAEEEANEVLYTGRRHKQPDEEK